MMPSSWFGESIDDDDFAKLALAQDAVKASWRRRGLLSPRVCSVCHESKRMCDFSAEERAKPASERVCDDCDPPEHSELALQLLGLEALRAMLAHRGAPTAGAKPELIVRLRAVLDLARSQRSAAARGRKRARGVPLFDSPPSSGDRSGGCVEPRMPAATPAVEPAGKRARREGAARAGARRSVRFATPEAAPAGGVPADAAAADASPPDPPGATREFTPPQRLCRAAEPASVTTGRPASRARSVGRCAGRALCKNAPSVGCAFGVCATCCQARRGAAAKRAAGDACARHPSARR